MSQVVSTRHHSHWKSASQSSVNASDATLIPSCHNKNVDSATKISRRHFAFLRFAQFVDSGQCEMSFHYLLLSNEIKWALPKEMSHSYKYEP